ncbi:PREDICTED: uncharacterized protein LOC105369040 [Ceratosolen solmsi marchali]|uniref:Uncharacterized protein LOC105369040 n=1 Tax=Ceratosolen solmsi marchali TaxID=326594 RepID=A0AAJ6YYC0_9HYME|nr:PREDICTED: uncharacterized protein LOC105369040 [Ceratosolen solmsi marchali]
MNIPFLMNSEHLFIYLFICIGLVRRLSTGCLRDDIVERFYYTSESSAEQPMHYETDVQVELLIIGRKVSWMEARMLCPLYSDQSSKASSIDLEALLANPARMKYLAKRRGKTRNNTLAVITDEDQANWLARMLSESNYRYDGLWIGGYRKNKTNGWSWISDGKSKASRVPKKILFESYPSWYHVSSKISSQQNCLLFNRIGHDIPVFIPENCQLRRPFICLRDVKRKLADKISESSSITVDGYRYTLYSVVDDNEVHYVNTGTQRLNGGGITWKDANIECKRRGKELAMIFSNDAATAIADMMLKNRPSMENVWLGGWSLDGGDWIWVPTGSSLSKVKSRSSQYPPWLEGHPIVNSQSVHYQRSSRCLILDRHLCPEQVAPVFLDLDCEKERPFVCQDGKIKDCPMCDIDFNNAQHEQMSRNSGRRSAINNEEFEFSEEDMTYEDAENYCTNRDGQIANILNSKILSTCLEKMSELAISHVWVGGRTVKMDNEWYWVDSNGNELSAKEIGVGGDTWCFGDQNGHLPKAEPNSCLNLDYESRGYPLFYGLPCNSSQIVLCRMPFNRSQNQVTEVRPDEVDTRIIGSLHDPVNKYANKALNTIKEISLIGTDTVSNIIKPNNERKKKGKSPEADSSATTHPANPEPTKETNKNHKDNNEADGKPRETQTETTAASGATTDTANPMSVTTESGDTTVAPTAAPEAVTTMKSAETEAAVSTTTESSSK